MGGGRWSPRQVGIKSGVKSCWSLSKAAEATLRMQLWVMLGRASRETGVRMRLIGAPKEKGEGIRWSQEVWQRRENNLGRAGWARGLGCPGRALLALLPVGHPGCLSLWLGSHAQPHGQPCPPGSHTHSGVARGSANSCGSHCGGWTHHCFPG